MTATKQIPFYTRFNPPENVYNDQIDKVSKTDTSKQEETDVYALMAKYGVSHTKLGMMTKPEHELFIDTTIIPKNMTLSDAIEFKNQFVDYFYNAPAKFRKLFKDNPDEFYLAYKQGEYDRLINAGALTQEQVEIQKNAIKAELQPMQDKITQYEALLTEERAKNERLNAVLNGKQNTQSNTND